MAAGFIFSGVEFTMTDTLFDLFPSTSRPASAAAEARARLAAAVTIVHGFLGAGKPPWCAASWNAEGRGTALIVNEFGFGRHRRRAAARKRRRGDAARQRVPLLQHPHRSAEHAAQAGRRPATRQKIPHFAGC